MGMMPYCAKYVLVLAWANGVICCYVSAFFSSQCFTLFIMTDTVADRLDGHAYNLFRRDTVHGRVFLFTLTCMLACLYIFNKWAAMRTKRVQVMPEKQLFAIGTVSTANGLRENTDNETDDSGPEGTY